MMMRLQFGASAMFEAFFSSSHGIQIVKVGIPTRTAQLERRSLACVIVLQSEAEKSEDKHNTNRSAANGPTETLE
jgi:hypothetical protein